MLLEGKKALVTGSRRGIGRAIAVALAREGCDIGLNDIERDEEADRTIRQVEAIGRKVSFSEADLSESPRLEQTFSEFLSEHGRIDIHVNNHFWAHSLPFLEITEEVWDRTMSTCLKSYFLCAQAAAKAMVDQGQGGCIVSISSVHAYTVWPKDTVYGTAKAAINRMTKSMALELADHSIRCNSIAPGYIDSQVLPEDREHERGQAIREELRKAIPSRRNGLPDDIAKAVVYLCSDMASYVNGHCLTVDGGLLIQGTP